MKIVFFGSSPFSIIVLEKIKEHVVAVVTKPDAPVGRHLKLTPNPVKVFAQKNNIRVFEDIKDFLQEDFKDCIGLVGAYGKMIGPKTLSSLNDQIYGIHPSLLPKYRGPSPLQQQILDGIVETGVTVLKIDLGEDTGPIVAQEKDVILDNDTKESLGNRLFAKGAELFLKSDLSKITPQDNSQATDTKMFTRQDGFIEWERYQKCLSLGIWDLDIARMQRAFVGWPGVWTIDLSGKRIKLTAI